MKKHRRCALIAAFWLVAVFVLGQVALMFPSREIYPFYSWTMFARVPGTVNAYELWIISWPGRVLESPVEIRDRQSPVHGGRSVLANSLVKRLGDFYSGDEEDTGWRDVRKQLELGFLKKGAVCELRVSSGDVLTMWELRKGGGARVPGQLLFRWEVE